MKRYNATKEKTKDQWTHETLTRATYGMDAKAATKTLRVLDLLNTEKDGQRIIDRTNTKKRFRMPVGFAEVIGIVTCELFEPPTEPPTELATVHDTLTSLFEYVKDQPHTPEEIVTGIGAAILHLQHTEAERDHQVVAIVAR